MKVICRINNLKNISDPYTLKRLKRYISKPGGEIDLNINQEYNVYGIVFWDNCPWFYLCPDNHDEYPKPFSSEFFEIIDCRIPIQWQLVSTSQGSCEPETTFVFNEWARDPTFYERLIEGELTAIKLFLEYKSQIDLYYSDESTNR